MPIYHIRTVIMLLAIALALVASSRIPSPRPRSFGLFGLIAFLAFPVEVAGYVTTLKQLNNTLLYNLFTYGEFLLGLAMVRSHKPRLGKVSVIFALAGTTGMAWDCVELGSLHVMLIEGILLMSFLLAVLISVLLWDMANTSTIALNRVPEFWLFMGMLIYFGGLPPVVAMARFVYAQDTVLVVVLWTIVPMLCTVRYILAAYACWSLAKQLRIAANG